MLKRLTIQNYALISNLEIEFSQGFSVITGETGAGKSIIIGALSLILGQRADAKSIQQGKDKCSIEGLFDISSYGLEAFFNERDLDYDTQNCILRREIWSSGKSRAFINDSPVSLTDLKELGTFLIDIHSQHQNLLLGDNRFQLQVLDVLAGNKNLREEYTTHYREFLSIGKQLKELKEKASEQAGEQDYLRFQFQQLEEAKLKPAEQTELEEELRILSNMEELKNGLYAIEHLLSDDNKGVVVSLKESLNLAQSLQKIYAPSGEIIERVQTAYLDLKDLSLEISRQSEKLELDPERLQWINERLDLIYSLQQKHKTGSVEALISLRDNLEAQLQEIENYDDEIAKLQKLLDASRQRVTELSGKVSTTRKKAAVYLEKQLVDQVSVLGMPYMQFSCRIMTKESPDATGIDDVGFLFTANKNGELKAVAQTASGGEISRLMLGIKSLIAGATALPTIIFDEIDTGVSGEIADKMGDIMHRMGEVMQVIAITHLPQIAAKGDSQFFVYKEEEGDFTETHIRRLSTEERIKEIAQMLSGSELTSAAIENAKELLK
ncbi:MAG: DNA repair protein RecN [Candidatus Symbiothrix sp.]|jgi:DNA repair protein RecN (Recombination protein N)|nr:DNA repair protein RecN [Candidatus Symbiothrix sp.]